MPLQPFVESNDLLDHPDDLRSRFDREGYVFFRRLLPRDDVIAVRQAILEICRDADWVADGSDLLDGRVKPERACTESAPEYLSVYRRVQQTEAFHSLGHHPRITGVMGLLLNEPVLPHPLKIARLMFPQNVKHTTAAHQDFVFIQGTPQTLTCWMPLGDCPEALGGLKVNAGTHRGSIYTHHFRLGAGGMGIDTDTLVDNWCSTDYLAGDALIFHSQLVHQGLPNVTPDRVRLSVDFRYQAQSQPISEISVKPHLAQLTWEEVYRGWKSTEFQYYWQRLNPQIIPYDTQYAERSREEAFELALRGDPISRSVLERIAERDADPARRERARQALVTLERLLQERGSAAN